MAKVPFSKLEIKTLETINKVNYINSKGEEITFEVNYYLPIEKKLDVISNIVNLSLDENGYYNPVRVQIFTVLEVVFAYTNLSFTAKQKEDPFKLYDGLVSSGLFKTIVENIRAEDWIEIQEVTLKAIDNIYKYRNSALGILEVVKEDYSGLSFETEKMSNILTNPDSLGLLKDVLTKLG